MQGFAQGFGGIDHLVVAVRDLEKAREAYARLGFTVTPRGRHTELKSVNHTIMFETDYVELLAIEEPNPATAHYTDFLKTREGLAAVALKTGDARAARQALADAGIAATDAVDFGRPVELPEGTRDARFTITGIDPAETPGGRVFLCQHHTRDLVWRPEHLTHENGATGLAALVIAADDPDAVAAAYARLFAGRAESASVESVGPARLVATGDTPILVAPPAALHWAWTSDPALTAPQPFLAGMVVRVADLDRAQRSLQKSKFPTVVGNDVMRVSSANACGVMLAFAKDFDLRTLIP